MRKAYLLVRDSPPYRREAFAGGLRSAGFDVRGTAPAAIARGDVVCMWNRYGDNHQLACRVEAAGGIVVVAENGYLKSRHDGGDHYALAIGGHNGSGRWHIGGAERWESLNIELRPWRTEGDHILVCPNRSFGRPDMIMPVDWTRTVRSRLEAITRRPVRVRPHPGDNKPKVPLEADLENAWACVIWASSCGVRALVAGVPVICEAPWWICRASAYTRLDRVESPEMRGMDVTADCIRRKALIALGWAQWRIQEIASGEPFDHLLSSAGQTKGVAAV